MHNVIPEASFNRENFRATLHIELGLVTEFIKSLENDSADFHQIKKYVLFHLLDTK